MASGQEDSSSSDYESSSSSFTGGISSDISFNSSSSISVRSFGAESFASSRSYKPHKSNEATWTAISHLRASSGQLTLNHFHLLRRLGSGDLGNVYLCRLKSPSSSLYAMKVVDKEALAVRNKLQRAETEKEILRTLDHPFLPTLFADFEASHFSCIVMEFCSGGDLHVARQRQPGRRFPLSSAKFYAAETLLAIEYLHMMGVVYRDLKPENVLVRDDGHIMLSDFDLSLKCDVVPRVFKQRHAEKSSNNNNSKNNKGGSSGIQPVLSCFYGGASKCTRMNRYDEDEEIDQDMETELVAEPFSARSKSFVGTHEYLAPEVISGLGHGSAVDWWTLGVFLYEMLYGRTPFKGENNEKTLINIIKQPVSFPKVAAVSEEMMRAQDLINKLLVKNPKKRIGSMKGSSEIKRHDFFRGVNWALIRSVKPPEVPRELRKGRTSKVAVQAPLMKLTRKQRDQPYNIPQYFDYF
ncbi:protein kinase PINOID 2 [Dioscorea cayenensis subsp. rotundata]|uniref:non-specific serine/threonine protein kinase n=1 Tax=Dioscorea cayennensis subsp. rotundata TaxID=55577 RepID=A0AB40BD34_DIOCR|nr:protein kinase PINOID 2 [Dioscorea cayenensis subsp. rotundata]